MIHAAPAAPMIHAAPAAPEPAPPPMIHAAPPPMIHAPPPYLASQTAGRAGRPVEPWKHSLRVVMFVWGVLLLAAFATPLSLDPLVFSWDAVLEAPGKAKIPPLVIAAVGLLSVVLAALPLAALARGVLANLLGLAGIFVPMLLGGMPPWQLLVQTVGLVLLVSALLVRNEYRDDLFPRSAVTVGVFAALVPYVVPADGRVLLVDSFQALIDAPGAQKVLPLLLLAHVVVLVLALLAWMPSPGTGGAKVFAWILIGWPLLTHAVAIAVVGDPSMIEKTPYLAMSWVAGGGRGGPGVAYLAIVGYGLATMIGKQLEPSSHP